MRAYTFPYDLRLQPGSLRPDLLRGEGSGTIPLTVTVRAAGRPEPSRSSATSCRTSRARPSGSPSRTRAGPNALRVPAGVREARTTPPRSPP
ncbi:MAG: hypothetical protein M0C28_22785 [Candidatus Moduliflexus flocculans]|nr:hypothetical protein [Candidatus Moduliflexus flocculans]